MSIKQTVVRMTLGLVLVFSLFAVISTPALAQQTCGGVDTSVIGCTQDNSGGIETTGLWGVLLLAINILTGLVAVAALGGIIWGSILYTSAGGSSEQVKKAMTVFTNVVIGIVSYGLMYVALNFLIPGGVFTQ